MSQDVSNDNAATVKRADDADAHGQAAILLIESLIHGLIERDVISVADAVEIVDTAHEVQLDVDADAHTPTIGLAGTLLQAISASLRGDLPDQ